MYWVPYVDLELPKEREGRPILRIQLISKSSGFYGRGPLTSRRATCYLLPSGVSLRGVIVVFHPVGVHVDKPSESKVMQDEFKAPFVEQTRLVCENEFVLIYPHWRNYKSCRNQEASDLFVEYVEWCIFESLLRQGVDSIDFPVFWAGSGEGGELAQTMASLHGGDGVYAIGCAPVFCENVCYPVCFDQLGFDDAVFESVWQDTVKFCSKCEDGGVRAKCSLVEPVPPFWSIERNRAAIAFLEESCSRKCLCGMRERSWRSWGGGGEICAS